MTDRFARTNDNDNSPCDVLKYCGGTWQGLTNHLDWIQDMGFTAVPPLAPFNCIGSGGNCRFGLVLFRKELKGPLNTAKISMVYLIWCKGRLNGRILEY